MLVDGKLSNNSDQQIDVLLKNFNLSTIRKLIPAEYVTLGGVVDGVASVSKKEQELLFTSDLSFNKFRINESLIGKGNVEALWNNTNQSLKIDGKFYRDFLPSIEFGGNYYPENEEESLDLKFILNQAELVIFNKYIKDAVSNLKGVADANITLKGNFAQPQLAGDINLSGVGFKINYLNTTYNAKPFKIKIYPDMITFDNVKLTDEYSQGDFMKGFALANGAIYHTWFKDLSIGIGIDAHNFMALNTTELENSLYYGKAFVTGLVDISSYEKQMSIDVNVKTDKNTLQSTPNYSAHRPG